MRTDISDGVITTREFAAAARELGAAGESTGAAQLLALLYDETVEGAAILACLHAEPTLAARVLKVANSAYYRCAGTVGTLERAVQILGTTAIRGIAAVGCMDRIAVPTVGKLFDSRRFRFHSLAVAAAAQSLSRLAGASIDSEAFMAGLLHDIGVVVLARLRPAAAVMLSEMSDLDEEGIRSAEVSLFGVDQVSASARVASQWNLPNWLSGALTPQVAPPTDRPYTGYDALPALLALGHRCAQQAGFGLLVLSAGDPKQDWFVALGLDPAACSAVAEEIPQSLRLLGSA